MFKVGDRVAVTKNNFISEVYWVKTMDSMDGKIAIVSEINTCGKETVYKLDGCNCWFSEVWLSKPICKLSDLEGLENGFGLKLVLSSIAEPNGSYPIAIVEGTYFIKYYSELNENTVESLRAYGFKFVQDRKRTLVGIRKDIWKNSRPFRANEDNFMIIKKHFENKDCYAIANFCTTEVFDGMFLSEKDATRLAEDLNELEK